MSQQQLQISQPVVERVVVKAGSTTTVVSKPRSSLARIVQSPSLLPVQAGDVADPGDLTLIFDNKLI